MNTREAGAEQLQGTKCCPKCAEDVQRAAFVCRFCGYRFDRRQGREEYLLKRAAAFAVTLAVLALLIVWATGTLDGPFTLYKVGLNAHDCYWPGDGATLCGGAEKRGEASAELCRSREEEEGEPNRAVLVGAPVPRCYHGIL